MLNTDFKEFLELLNELRVEYLVVGGYALAIHGHPRYTGDIDIWLRPEPSNIEKLILVLSAFGFASLGLKEQDFLEKNAIVQLGFAPARIDLLTSIDGVTFDQAYARHEVKIQDDIPVPVIHIEDFKINKRAAGRYKDLADIEAIEKKEQR